MKIIIRYLGMSIVKKDLEPGEYNVGRSGDNDIQIPHDFISRRHAKIFFKDNQWWYQDLRVEHIHYQKDPIKITQETKIELENRVELITEDYLDVKKTVLYKADDITGSLMDGKKSRRRPVAMPAIIGFLLIAVIGGIYYFSITLKRQMDANTLFEFVRPKIVEFVKIKDPKAIRDLKQYAGAKEKDFIDEIGYCTGFIVRPGIVLSANHCLHGISIVDSDVRFKLKTHDGKLHDVARILGFDLKKDFLYLDVPGLKEYGCLEISTEECKVGEKVYTIGNVAGEGIAIRDGIMAGKTKDLNDPNIEFVRYSAAASPGNSGGPLVNGLGKVIALVFASTRTENYNLGTGSKNLLEGIDRFVDNQEPKKVKIETRNLLNFHPNSLAYLLYLPISNVWFENPHLALPLENVVTEVNVPTDLPTHYDTLIPKFNVAALNKFEQVQAKIEESGFATEKWASQVTKETPVIIPYQTNMDALYSKSKENNRLIPEKIAILTPMQPHSYNKFKKKLKDENRYYYIPTAQILTLNTDIKLGDDSYSFIYRTGSSTYKDQLDRFSIRPVCQYIGRHVAGNTGWDDVRQVSAKTVLKGLAGKGMLSSSYDSLYLRPNAKRQFTIKRFDEETTESSFKDILGRSWKVFSFKLFGNTTIDNYCLKLPQGVLCLSVSYYTDSDSLLHVLRENYLRYNLPSMIISPVYWSVDALHDYYAKGLAGNLPLMNDVGFKKLKNGGITITLKTLGIKFSIPKSKVPQTLRFISGMYYNGGHKKWISLGFEGIRSDKENWKVSSIGVELKGSNASSILSRIRAEEKSKKKLKDKPEKDKVKKGKSNLKLWRKDIKSKKSGIDVTIFGYSAPIVKHEDSDRFMSIDFSFRKPFKVAYQLM